MLDFEIVFSLLFLIREKSTESSSRDTILVQMDNMITAVEGRLETKLAGMEAIVKETNIMVKHLAEKQKNSVYSAVVRHPMPANNSEELEQLAAHPHMVSTDKIKNTFLRSLKLFLLMQLLLSLNFVDL